MMATERAALLIAGGALGALVMYGLLKRGKNLAVEMAEARRDALPELIILVGAAGTLFDPANFSSRLTRSFELVAAG